MTTKLHRSTDGGSVWNSIHFYLENGGACTFDPSDTTIYWYGGEDQAGLKSVARSTDMGASWTSRVLSEDGDGICLDIAVKPDNSNIAYAAGPPAFHKTTDGGTTWNPVTNGITGVINAVIVDHHNNNVVYAGGDDGVFKSMNEGQTWNNEGLTDVNVLYMDPDDNDVIYAGTDSGLYKSSDGGENWNDENGGLEDLRVTAFGMAPSAYIFTGTRGSGMYRWEIVIGTEESAFVEEKASFTVLPNPISTQATITYSVSQETRVSLGLYDVQGRLVHTISNMIHTPGTYTVHWDGTDVCGCVVPAGVYFFRLERNGQFSIRKTIVLPF